MAAMFLSFKYLTFYLFCLLYSTCQALREGQCWAETHRHSVLFVNLKGNDFNISSLSMMFAVDFI